MKSLNATVIHLAPKIPNASHPKDFRPIACYNVLYKILTKMLANRMMGVLNGIVSKAQSTFIPDRNISDNILTCHELVKAYSRKQISPTCMLKIDIQKPYDSLSWSFIHQVLQGLGFLEQFVQWVMMRISSPAFPFA